MGAWKNRLTAWMHGQMDEQTKGGENASADGKRDGYTCMEKVNFHPVGCRGVDQGASGASMDAPGVGL